MGSLLITKMISKIIIEVVTNIENNKVQFGGLKKLCVCSGGVIGAKHFD